MKYVAVKHKKEQSSLYWFVVPAQLRNRVSVGSHVKCDTSRGITDGIVQIVVDGATEDQLRRLTGVYGSLKDIVGVYCYVELRLIAIPINFQKAIPSGKKLEQRLQEYQAKATFDTPVVIDYRGLLKDGYTAVFVARALNLKYIEVLCEVTT